MHGTALLLELDEALDRCALLLELGGVLVELDDPVESDELLPSDGALELLNALLPDGALLLE